jgi:DNA-binding beta-propeller fold protein YncE
VGQFSGPLGIDVGQEGKIYIADKGNKRIQIFDARGEYLHSFPVKNKKTLVAPIDVKVSRNGEEIYVSGNTNHKVMVFTGEGQALREWGGSGLNPGEFRYPGTIARLQDDRIAVVDILNTRIQVFEPSGSFSVQVGEWGILQGQLFRPKGVAVDNKNDIFVSDSYTNLVQVFMETGVFKHVLKPIGMSDALETPVGMTIGEDNRLYVTEMLKNRVSVFELGK